MTMTNGASGNLTLYGSDYIVPMADSNNVTRNYIGIADTGSNDNEFILGDPFLSAFYTIFDAKNSVMSFARSIQN